MSLFLRILLLIQGIEVNPGPDSNVGKLRSHDSNRSIICTCCGRKDAKCFKVTPSIEQMIRDEVFSDYDAADPYLPNGCCVTCRTSLFRSKKGKIVPENVRDRWNSVDFSRFGRPSRTSPCGCHICCTARFVHKNFDQTAPTPDVPRKPEQEISEDPEDEVQIFPHFALSFCHKFGENRCCKSLSVRWPVHRSSKTRKVKSKVCQELCHHAIIPSNMRTHRWSYWPCSFSRNHSI